MLTAGVILATAWVALMSVWLPTSWTPGCLFKAWTGYPCLTCGAYRCLTALRAGHLTRAFQVQPLLATLAMTSGVWVFYVIGGNLAGLSRVRLHLTRREAWLLAGAAVMAVLGNWAYLIARGV